MPTIIVQGRPVRVSNSFFEFSPGEQSATVREIAQQMTREAGTGQPSVNSSARADRPDAAAMAPAWRDGFGLPTPAEASNSERKSDRDLPQPEPSWSDAPKNVVPSAVNAVTGLYETVRHPVRTLQALETVAGGAMNLMGADELNVYLADRGLAARRNPEDVAREEAAAKAVGQALKDRYWGLDNLKKTMITDPVGSALDILGIAGGGYGLVRQGLSLGSKARLAEIPGPALDAERLAANELSPAVARNNIDWTTGSKSNTIRQAPSNAGPSDDIQTMPNAQHMSTNAFNPASKPRSSLETDYARAIGRKEIAGARNLSVDTGGYPPTGQFAGGTPRQTFLTKDLEKKRHNYPPDQMIADGVSPSQHPSTSDIWNTHNAPPKFREIFNPPDKAQRPFAADYPKTPAHDVNGKLLEDVDGDPIIAPYVAGRQTLGGNDVGFSPKQFLEIAKKLVKVETVPRADINNASGKLFTDPDTMEPTVIRIADDLNETRQARVIGHELAHAMHAKTGFKPIIDPAMRNELERNYSMLASGPDSKTFTRPSDIDSGYRDPIKSDRELVADATYAALRKPNYGKTELPVFYRTLRQWIKSNPDLAKLLINNSIAATTVAAALGATGESKEATAAEASSPRARQGNGPKNPGALPSAFIPSRLGGGATKASADGLTELKKALFRRGLYPRAPGNGKFRDLVRALADLEARQEPQP